MARQLRGETFPALTLAKRGWRVGLAAGADLLLAGRFLGFLVCKGLLLALAHRRAIAPIELFASHNDDLCVR